MGAWRRGWVDIGVVGVSDVSRWHHQKMDDEELAGQRGGADLRADGVYGRRVYGTGAKKDGEAALQVQAA